MVRESQGLVFKNQRKSENLRGPGKFPNINSNSLVAFLHNLHVFCCFGQLGMGLYGPIKLCDT